jgi:hypothetical protein
MVLRGFPEMLGFDQIFLTEETSFFLLIKLLQDCSSNETQNQCVMLPPGHLPE